ncbi:hypothetical protein HDU92_008344 [Lobulomyces angularis]|nr:hypothetical protein HDU92_008344 [Lobulomyces angularis]
MNDQLPSGVNIVEDLNAFIQNAAAVNNSKETLQSDKDSAFQLPVDQQQDYNYYNPAATATDNIVNNNDDYQISEQHANAFEMPDFNAEEEEEVIEEESGAVQPLFGQNNSSSPVLPETNFYVDKTGDPSLKTHSVNNYSNQNYGNETDSASLYPGQNSNQYSSYPNNLNPNAYPVGAVYPGAEANPPADFNASHYQHHPPPPNINNNQMQGYVNHQPNKKNANNQQHHHHHHQHGGGPPHHHMQGKSGIKNNNFLEKKNNNNNPNNNNRALSLSNSGAGGNKMLDDRRKPYPVYPPNTRLFIGNLAVEATSKEEIFNIFSAYGEVAEVALKTSYGFVQFANLESCTLAMEKEQGRLIGSQHWDLKYSKEKSVPHGRQGGAGNDKGKEKNRDRDRRDYDDRKDRRRSRSPRRTNDRKRSRSRDKKRDYDDRRDRRRSSSPRRRSRERRGSNSRYDDRYDDHHSSRGDRSLQGTRIFDLSDSKVLENFNNQMLKSLHHDSNGNKVQEELPLPRKPPNQVSDAQIICFSVDKPYVWEVEQVLKKNNFNFDTIFLSQRFNPKSIVKQRFVEGVKSIFYLDRQGQRGSTVDLQIFHLDKTITDYPGILIENAVKTLSNEREVQRNVHQQQMLQQQLQIPLQHQIQPQIQQNANLNLTTLLQNSGVDLNSLLSALQNQQQQQNLMAQRQPVNPVAAAPLPQNSNQLLQSLLSSTANNPYNAGVTPAPLPRQQQVQATNVNGSLSPTVSNMLNRLKDFEGFKPAVTTFQQQPAAPVFTPNVYATPYPTSTLPQQLPYGRLPQTSVPLPMYSQQQTSNVNNDSIMNLLQSLQKK